MFYRNKLIDEVLASIVQLLYYN